MNKTQQIKMKKTKSPADIPNGTVGWVQGGGNIKEAGLHHVKFVNGFSAYVFGHEVEICEKQGET